MRFLKKYWLELAAFADLELFVWSATRRYWGEPLKNKALETVLDALIMVSGIALCFFIWRLSKKWRERTAEQVRVLSRKLLRRISERVLQILERWQRRLGRNTGDLLGGRTRMEFDLYGDRGKRGKHRRAAWRQLESEREKIRWLYAGMVESRLKRGTHILPSDTPSQIARRKDSTPEQCELITWYEDCRYDPRRSPPEGAAQRWRDGNG